MNLVPRDAAAVAHEEGLALFVSPEWRARFRQSLAQPHARRKVAEKLAHFRHLDPRFVALEIASRDRRSDVIGPELRRRGAGPTCHVVAESELDGRTMGLDEALELIVDSGSMDAAFISCVAGRLAYFHDEEIESRYILERVV